MSLIKNVGTRIGLSLLNISTRQTSTHPIYHKGWGSIKSWFNTVYGNSSDTIQNSKKSQSQLEAEFQSWVAVCIDLITNRMSDLNFDVYRKGPDGDRKLSREQDGPVYDNIMAPLRRPNKEMSWRVFWQIVQMQWEIFGYSIVYKARNPLNIVKEFYPLDVRFLDEIKIGKTVGDGIEKFIFKSYGSFNPEDVIYFRYPDPFNFYRGRSKLQNLGIIPTHDYFMDRFFTRFFKYDARPSMLIGYDGKVSTTKQREILNQWEERFSGNPFLPAILDEGAMVKTIEIDLKKLDLESMDKRIRDKVLTMWNVPVSAIGLAEDVNRATAAALNPEFNTNAILPIVKFAEEFLTYDYLTNEYDPDGKLGLYIQYDNPVPRDKDFDQERIKNYRPYMTVNEMRNFISNTDLEVNLPVLADEGANIIWSNGRPPEPLARIPFDATNVNDDPVQPIPLVADEPETEPSTADRIGNPYGINPVMLFSYYEKCHNNNPIIKYKIDCGLVNLYAQMQQLEKAYEAPHLASTIELVADIINDICGDTSKQIKDVLMHNDDFLVTTLELIYAQLQNENKDCTALVKYMFECIIELRASVESFFQ